MKPVKVEVSIEPTRKDLCAFNYIASATKREDRDPEAAMEPAKLSDYRTRLHTIALRAIEQFRQEALQERATDLAKHFAAEADE